jgi:hypothetical protein
LPLKPCDWHKTLKASHNIEIKETTVTADEQRMQKKIEERTRPNYSVLENGPLPEYLSNKNLNLKVIYDTFTAYMKYACKFLYQ